MTTTKTGTCHGERTERRINRADRRVIIRAVPSSADRPAVYAVVVVLKIASLGPRRTLSRGVALDKYLNSSTVFASDAFVHLRRVGHLRVLRRQAFGVRVGL